MENLKESLEKTEDFMRKIEAKNTSGETGMPDAKKRRGEAAATASDSDKSPRTNEANVGVSVDADGDANMRSEQV